MGGVVIYFKVHTWGKWAEKGWHFCDTYLPYALGGGYVIAGSLVRHIARNSGAYAVFKSEDVSLGLWTASLNVTRKHDTRFDP